MALHLLQTQLHIDREIGLTTRNPRNDWVTLIKSETKESDSCLRLRNSHDSPTKNAEIPLGFLGCLDKRMRVHSRGALLHVQVLNVTNKQVNHHHFELKFVGTHRITYEKIHQSHGASTTSGCFPPSIVGATKFSSTRPTPDAKNRSLQNRAFRISQLLAFC